ncbi:MULTISPECIES: protein-disulfide reductase DsbD family protein [Flavobacteriales]|uniref:Thiol:disulfide interchange protein DsbD n=3 Tax=Flavobacteriales TaxID=200644 RepID=A0A0D0EN82_9FLAO|nr:MULTISPECIES: cytochrome c biogenesis protein CcdA [Flavobacteriales]KIO54385.1 thiol:disulfide interchange protein DsbD [Flavobacterium hibernum]OXA88145.1 thiol:disulfide interchange protein DsbD [Flavobacterium hibernum]SEG30745.1 thiol:disulfide interchange protein DsbD [Halpernia humi]STO10764.1 Thiol:disulfide interchange protein DsbD precursor [Flavobacterium hibernum]
MRLISKILTVLFIFGLVAVTANAQTDSLVSHDDVEFTEITEQQPVQKESIATSKEPETLLTNENGVTLQKNEATTDKSSLWAIFIAGFIGGFAALLMPCIFPMLPLTVSFFTKSGHTKRRAVIQAMIYGLSIILIYVLLGIFITLIFGADALNSLSTNGIFNFAFFALLVVFAFSFFGAFELTLPASLANKLDRKADRGGLLGLFFMAATLAVVSFSCTGPIIGTLLVQAATMGELLGPAIGMLGFALALAIPFTLFAMFPSLLKSLPSSGGWLNSVKITLGFLELALALKFLSNVDLAYHWNWFDREVFLALWIIIFGYLGFYLLGKIRFPNDSPMDTLSLPRMVLSILVLSFTLYMVPGLWGAPLKSISAFLPPQTTQDFDLYTSSFGRTETNNVVDSKARKYSDIFHAPLNLNVFFDYEEGIEYGKKVGKPVMLDFTGHACVNCRKMEASVWSDKDVHKLLNEELIIIQLYVDDKTELPQAEQFVSSFSGKNIRTIGNKWSDFQASKFNSNSQPHYVLLDPSNEEILIKPTGADYNQKSYYGFIQSAINKYKSKNL